jgi:hypothetical protein
LIHDSYDYQTRTILGKQKAMHWPFDQLLSIHIQM